MEDDSVPKMDLVPDFPVPEERTVTPVLSSWLEFPEVPCDPEFRLKPNHHLKLLGGLILEPNYAGRNHITPYNNFVRGGYRQNLKSLHRYIAVEKVPVSKGKIKTMMGRLGSQAAASSVKPVLQALLDAEVAEVWCAVKWKSDDGEGGRQRKLKVGAKSTDLHMEVTDLQFMPCTRSSAEARLKKTDCYTDMHAVFHR